MMSKKEIMLANAQRKAKKLTSDDEVRIRCKLCNNQTTDEHLERHIKYNHIISNDEMFYKIYYMHFPEKFPDNVKHTDTQTRISWIGDDMDNQEESQNNISNRSDPIQENSNKITCTVCGQFFENLEKSTNVVECPGCLESSPQPGPSRKLEETADVEASPKVTSSAVSEPSINMNEHCVEEEGLKAENLQTAESGNKELALATEECIPDLAMDNISGPANEHIALNKVSENEIVKGTDEPNELHIVSNNFSSNSLLDPSFESVVKNWPINDNEIFNKKVMRDVSPLCLRYKCPYCEEHNRKVDNIQDHILTHHSNDPNLLTSDSPVPPIKEQTMKIYLPKDSDWIEACLKESCYQMPPEDCPVDTLNYNWIDGNPELPKHWKFSTVENQLGVSSMHYLSPCGMVFKSKQKFMDFLIKEGKKAKILFRSKCDGFCEGNCSDFVIPEYFYNVNDPNKVRPKTKLKLILDRDVNAEAKVKEKLIKGVPKIPKTLAIAGVRYRLPGNATQKDRKNYLLEDTDSESESEDNSFNFKNDESIYSHPIFLELNEINVHNQSAMKEGQEEHALENKEPQRKGRGRPKTKMKEMWSQSPTFIGLPSTSDSELSCTNFKQKQEEKSVYMAKNDLDTPTEAVDTATTSVENLGTSLLEKGKGKDLMDGWETNIGNKYKSRNQSGDLNKSFEDNGMNKIETGCSPSDIYAAKKVDITYNYSESDCKDAKVEESAVDEGSDSGKKEKVKRISNSSKSSGGSTKRNSSIDRDSKKRKGSTDSCDKKLNTIKPNRLGLIGFDEVFQSKKSNSKSASPALQESESEEEHGDSTQIIHNEKANEEKEPTTTIESINLKRYEGIDVQCCKKKCERWHRLTEFRDASDVPQYWICSMNQDKSNNKCVRKKDIKKLAKPEYKLGNMVWVKYEDLPWWPAVVTIDGDSEEYFWIEWEVSKTVPQQYHITYFEDGIEISGIWLPTERIQKMTSTLDAPAKSKMDSEMRRKYKEAVNKANVFLELPRQERIDTQLADTKAYDEWNHEDQEKINGVDDIQNNKQKIPKLKLKRKRIETTVDEDAENAHVVKSKRKSPTSDLVDEKLDEFDLETERSKIRKKKKFNEIESEDEELDYIRNIKNNKRKKAVKSTDIESDSETNGDETHQIKEKKHSKTNEIKLEHKDVRLEKIYKSRRNKPKRTNYPETEHIDNADSEHIFRSKRNRPLKNNHNEQEHESNTGNEHTYRSNHEKTIKTDKFEEEKYSEDNEQIYKSKRHKPINNIHEKQENNFDKIEKGKNKTARSNKIEVDSKIISPPKSPLKKMPGKVKSTFNCEHCNANIPYNMQQVDFHVQEHGYTMTGYMEKYDVSDDPNLDTLRRWVNKMKPRNQASLAASVPVKIKTEKCDDSVETSGEAARSDIPLVKTENSEVSTKENVVGSSSLYVEEYQQRKGRDQTQSLPLVKAEELLDSVDESNFQVYPTIPYDVLIALSVRNLDRDNFRGASFNQMIAFVCLHFPYFNRNVEKLKALIKKSYNRVNNESDKLKIQDEHIESLRKRVDTWRIRNKDEVKKFMWIPDFLEIIVERFSDQNHLLTDNPAMKAKPPYSRKMVLYLALISVSPPSTTDKIWIFIRFLFPSLEKSVQGFERQDFDNDLLEEENISEIEDNSGQKMYAIREGFLPEVRHNVRNYFSTISNLKQLKKSILKPEFVDLLLPNLGMP